MAVSSRTISRQRDFSKVFIILGVIAGAVAIAPIVAAILGFGSAVAPGRTAFATAPSGEYALIARSEGEADVISMAWAQSPGTVTEIARIPRLDGFPSSGAVSPDGKRLALTAVDRGSASHPEAALLILKLETGEVARAAQNVLPGQVPVWTDDSSEVVVVRLPAGNESAGPHHVVRVSADGSSERLLQERSGVLGIYPVGFDDAGKLVSVVIDARGSTVLRDAEEVANVSSSITRDWELSPDGNSIAFIEANTDAGVRYLARTVALGGGNAFAQALSSDTSALGVAWNPADSAPTFGLEPGQKALQARTEALTVDGASAPSGFDVPLGYSKSGSGLVVTHWNGTSFSQAGTAELQVLAGGVRSAFPGFNRFFGWSTR